MTIFFMLWIAITLSCFYVVRRIVKDDITSKTYDEDNSVTGTILLLSCVPFINGVILALLILYLANTKLKRKWWEILLFIYPNKNKSNEKD